MADGPSPPHRERSRAVLIGTSRFDHLTPLPAVSNNLAGLKAALTHPEYGILSAENCEIVDGPRAPRDLMAPLRKAARRTDDLLLVYYAGHGLRHEHWDELFLTVGESDADALAESAVPFHAVRDVLEHSTARTNVLVLDCCYSGMALSSMSGVAVEAREIAVSGSAVLASSPKNMKSHSPVGQPHTAFTGKMIALLEKGSPNEGEQLTVNVLYRRISTALLNESFPRPLIKLTDTSGDLLVRRSAVSEPQPPEPPPAPATDDSSRETPQPLSPEPSPAPDDRATPGKATTQVRIRWRQALWILTGIAFALLVSGVVGVISDEKSAPGQPSTPSTLLWTGLAIVAISGASLVLLYRRWGDLGTATTPPLLGRSNKGRLALVACVVAFVAAAITMPFSDTMEGAKPSDIAGPSMLALESAAACGYLLYRSEQVRRRTNRR